MSQSTRTTTETSDAPRLRTRLDEIGWALFLIMTGAVWLVPTAWAPEGTWLTGLGLILLGVNAARYRFGIGVSGFGVAVGVAAIVGGVGRILGGPALFLPILLLLLGTALAVRTVVRASAGAPCR